MIKILEAIRNTGVPAITAWVFMAVVPCFLGIYHLIRITRMTRHNRRMVEEVMNMSRNQPGENVTSAAVVRSPDEIRREEREEMNAQMMRNLSSGRSSGPLVFFLHYQDFNEWVLGKPIIFKIGNQSYPVKVSEWFISEMSMKGDRVTIRIYRNFPVPEIDNHARRVIRRDENAQEPTSDVPQSRSESERFESIRGAAGIGAPVGASEAASQEQPNVYTDYGDIQQLRATNQLARPEQAGSGTPGRDIRLFGERIQFPDGD